MVAPTLAQSHSRSLRHGPEERRESDDVTDFLGASRFLQTHDLEGVTSRAEAAHRRYYGQVYRYVRRRTRNREDAEDVTQTVFAEAVRGLELSAAASPPALAWLYTVARRRLIDQQRRQSSPGARVISLDEARLEHRSPDDYGVDVARALAEGIRALPREQRDVVVLKLVEGRRFEEIAAQLGISEEAGRARLSRALRTLRARIEKEGIKP
jgi:RNA polymerase sigma-70 factor, ECF subfamily